jgi:hypothetical protein
MKNTTIDYFHSARALVAAPSPVRSDPVNDIKVLARDK